LVDKFEGHESPVSLASDMAIVPAGPAE